jgi:hypothetical protein
MTTETLALTDFLLARIAEDEARAITADPALWEPHFIVLECAAKRRIVELHKSGEENGETFCYSCDGYAAAEGVGYVGYPCETLRALAAAYAAHPDYREEWRADRDE